jgi:hypothetical protein
MPDNINPRPADPQLMKEAWLDIVAPVERAGRLDHIPARKPMNKKEVDTARKQNYAVTRRTFGMPDNYNRIDWSRK